MKVLHWLHKENAYQILSIYVKFTVLKSNYLSLHWFLSKCPIRSSCKVVLCDFLNCKAISFSLFRSRMLCRRNRRSFRLLELRWSTESSTEYHLCTAVCRYLAVSKILNRRSVPRGCSTRLIFHTDPFAMSLILWRRQVCPALDFSREFKTIMKWQNIIYNNI